MKIIRPYARIIRRDTRALSVIEQYGRVSHRSENKQEEDSWREFISNVVIKHGDWSIVEHVSASVESVMDRGITHEWVRHRLASYTQESTRFVRYFKEKEGDVLNPAQFIYPIPEIECDYCLAGFNEPKATIGTEWKHFYPDEERICAYDGEWLIAVHRAEMAYKSLLQKKWRPQEARSVFPNALASKIITTTNLRAWRHFLIMRTTAEAHPQMRQITIPLLKEFQDNFPLIFDDIVPMAKQSEQMRKAK